MTVTKEKYVTIAYNFSTPEGYLLGTSDRQGPLTFCAGSGDIIPGLDQALAGAEEGQVLDFVISAADAYGERDESLVAKVAAADLGLAGEPKIGYRVEPKSVGAGVRPSSAMWKAIRSRSTPTILWREWPFRSTQRCCRLVTKLR